MFHLPAGSRVSDAAMPDGAGIRTFCLDRDDARANALVLNGRADFLEKWADAYAGLADIGLALAAWDWRGQGRSSRLADNGAGHMDRFERWLDDMDVLAEGALAVLPERPWVAVAHSMGGHLLLRWLADPARAGHPLRAQLRGAVLLAPFFGLGMAWPLRVAVLAAARREVARGHGADFALGQGPYGDRSQAQARMLLLTASRERFLDEGRWVAADPALACGGVSWGFLKAFADSQQALEALPLEELALPMLVIVAGRERLVANADTERLVRRLPTARLETVADGAHELLREADVPRRKTLSKIAAFVDKVTA